MENRVSYKKSVHLKTVEDEGGSQPNETLNQRLENKLARSEQASGRDGFLLRLRDTDVAWERMRKKTFTLKYRRLAGFRFFFCLRSEEQSCFRSWKVILRL